MKTLIKLSALILNIIVRSKSPEELQDNFSDIISLLQDLGIDTLEARSINRKFQEIEDSIIKSCKNILQHSISNEERIEVIVNHVCYAYENAGISIGKFLSVGATADAINKVLIKSNQKYIDDLDTREAELYERVLEHTSHIIESMYIKLPEFNQQGIKRLNARMDELVEKVDATLEVLAKVNAVVEDKAQRVSSFERSYRNNVISQNEYVHLFGAGDLEGVYRRYPLSIAYVELELAENSTGKDIKLQRIFQKNNNVWLSGDAGLGKTTLLQWIAVEVAKDSKQIYGTRDCIPVMIHLRKYDCKNMSLKKCIDDVMRDSSYSIPEGWIDELKETGRFVFLLDGFDEITEDDRKSVLAWLQQNDSRNKCKKIFTARPQVKERPYSTKVLEVNIVPMNRTRTKAFIEYWHRAVLEEQLKVENEDSRGITNELYEKIGMTNSLLKLASIPLLCSMICALHHRNQMHLPTNQRELYEECCKLLLEKRDEERRIVYTKLSMSYERKKFLLSKLAYWMMKNDYVQVSIEEAEEEIGRAIGSMGISADNKDVFQYLFERCGILREPERGKIDFLHRTFQEYLTAYQIHREADWGLLKGKIGDPVWQETIAISLGYAKKETVNDFLETTLQKGIDLDEEKPYLFLAIEYLNGAIEVDEEIRKEIETSASELIPPESDDCMELAKAGNLVVSYLKNKEDYTSEEREVCLEVLRRIGTVNALEVSKTYLKQKLSKSEAWEFGTLIQQFTKRELIETGIPSAVKEYIERICEETVTVDYDMLYVLKYLGEDGFDCLREIEKLEIVGVDNRRFLNNIDCFENLVDLSLDGNFCRIDFLKNMLKLQGLSIFNRNEKFLIDNLSWYPVARELKRLIVISYAREYICGNNLEFLYNCKNLEIILLDNMSEIYFDKFDYLKSLKTLTIGAEFALDLNYSEIPRTLERLTIVFPKDSVGENDYRRYVSPSIWNYYFMDLNDYLDAYHAE